MDQPTNSQPHSADQSYPQASQQNVDQSDYGATQNDIVNAEVTDDTVVFDKITYKKWGANFPNDISQCTDAGTDHLGNQTWKDGGTYHETCNKMYDVPLEEQRLRENETDTPKGINTHRENIRKRPSQTKLPVNSVHVYFYR